jgi:hypothetical protein
MSFQKINQGLTGFGQKLGASVERLNKGLDFFEGLGRDYIKTPLTNIDNIVDGKLTTAFESSPFHEPFTLAKNIYGGFREGTRFLQNILPSTNNKKVIKIV